MDLEFEEIKEYHALHKFVEDKYDKEKKNYLFVDEVQLCPNFELAINSLFPFSFKEYCEYYNDQADKDKLFEEYFIKGGLAGSYAYNTELDRTTYTKEVYETIVNRDLVQKYNLADTGVLRQLSEFLMDNISSIYVMHLYSMTLRDTT